MLKTKKQVKNGEWFRDQIRAFLIRNGATEQLNKAYEFVIITKMGTLQVSGNHHAVLVLRRDAKSLRSGRLIPDWQAPVRNHHSLRSLAQHRCDRQPEGCWPSTMPGH
jgi:hypothetical protein